MKKESVLAGICG